MLNQQFLSRFHLVFFLFWIYFAIHIACAANDCETILEYIYIFCLCFHFICTTEQYILFFRLPNTNFVFIRFKLNISDPMDINVWRRKKKSAHNKCIHWIYITSEKKNRKRNYSTKWSYKNVYEFPIPIWIFL